MPPRELVLDAASHALVTRPYARITDMGTMVEATSWPLPEATCGHCPKSLEIVYEMTPAIHPTQTVPRIPS